MSVLEVALDPSTVIVAVDPGKAFNRVWISDGSGLLADPMTLSVSREGIAQLESALGKHGSNYPVIAIEATGNLHRPWVCELERRHPGSVRVFAPSETKSARMQLGSGRFKTDDRDCAALTYMARQGGGRRFGQQAAVEALRAAVRYRRGLVADRKAPSSDCMTSSTHCAQDYQPHPGMAERWQWKHLQVLRCWHVQLRSQDERRSCGH